MIGIRDRVLSWEHLYDYFWSVLLSPFSLLLIHVHNWREVFRPLQTLLPRWHTHRCHVRFCGMGVFSAFLLAGSNDTSTGFPVGRHEFMVLP